METAELLEVMKKGARVDGGKVKVNEHGEMYIERRGRKPGNKKSVSLSHASSSSSIAVAGPVGIARRRASVRNALRRGALNSNSAKLADLRDRYVSRRSLLFKTHCPSRAPIARAAIRVLEHTWHQNIKYSVGDIVSLTDEDDNKPYFAQIRGIVVDPMMKAFAALTWLIPKQSAVHPHVFDAEHFAHGLVDAKNYHIQDCEWVAPRPKLAAYQKEWTPQKAAAESIRAEVVNRWKQLREVADEELRRVEQKPLLNLEERITEERLQA